MAVSLCGQSGGGDGANFCRARERLPETVFAAAMLHTAEQPLAQAPAWKGLRVLHVDGVTMRAPRSPDNIDAFGHSSSGLGGSVLPVVRIVLAACAYTGVVLAARLSTQSSTCRDECKALSVVIGSYKYSRREWPDP